MSKDFFREFHKGFRSYDTWMGDWWHRQSLNAAHQRAYRKIAQYMELTVSSRSRREPRMIVDYACGNGAVIKALRKRFAGATLVGLDGSGKMLRLAKEYIGPAAEIMPAWEAFAKNGPPVRLIQSPLPDLSLPAGKADVVLFLFPNMNYSRNEKARLAGEIHSDQVSVSIARLLSRIPEPGEKPSEMEMNELWEDMLLDRAVSANIHRLLRRGGLWFKVEYSNVRREKLSRLDTAQTLFGESAWDVNIDGRIIRDRFRLLESRYYRSSVVLDVYDQSQDPDDQTGGYFVSTFVAR